MIRSAMPGDEWKLINFRVVDCLLAAEMLHDLYQRHRPSINAIRFRNTVITYRGGLVHAYAPRAEWAMLETWFADRFLAESTALRGELRAYCARPFIRTPALIAHVHACGSLCDNDLAVALMDLQHGALGELYEINLVQVEHALVTAVRRQLARSGRDQQCIDQALVSLSRTDLPTAAGRERVEFEQIVSLHGATSACEVQPELEAALLEHLRRWGHLRNAYGRNGLSLEDLSERLRRTQAQGARDRTMPLPDAVAQDIAADHLLMDNGELLRLVGSVRDRQKAQMGEVGEARGKILGEIAVRRSVPRDELNFYLLDEICNLIRDVRRVAPAELASRRQMVVLRRSEQLLTHLPADMALPQLAQSDAAAILRGRCASPGAVVGRAVIVRGRADVAKVQADSIMLAPGTDFDVIDAMERARAIATEEGGLLSHAAVIARELGTPCLVGVTDLTALLQDGEWLELDATKGFIRRLERIAAPDGAGSGFSPFIHEGQGDAV